jgi:hypothetical protein
MGNQMSIEQATAEAFQKLRDVNVAAALWEGFKQELLNRSEDWQRQRSLGVSNAYLPPELVPQPEVPVAEVVDALRSLQSGCVQIQQPLAPSTEQASLFVVGDEMPALEPEGEVAATVSAQTPEPVSLSELQEKLNSRRYVNIARMMIRSNPGWGYKLDEELNLVLPADGSMPLQGHIQSLLDNKLTKNSALALIEKHPEWGLFVDDEGQLWD